MKKSLITIIIIAIIIALFVSTTYGLITTNIETKLNLTYRIGNSSHFYNNISVYDIYSSFLHGDGSNLTGITASATNGTMDALTLNNQLGVYYNNLDNGDGDVNSSQIEDGTIMAVDISWTFNTTAEIQTVINDNPTGNTTAEIVTVINANPTGNTTAEIVTVINANPTGNTSAEIITAVNGTNIFVDYANNSGLLNGFNQAFYQNLDNMISGNINASQIDSTFGNTTAEIQTVINANPTGNTTAEIQTVINANPTGNTTAEMQTVINANPTGNTTAEITTVVNANPTGNTTVEIQTVSNANPTGNSTAQIITAVNSSAINSTQTINTTSTITIAANDTKLWFGSENNGFIMWNSTCDCLQIG